LTHRIADGFRKSAESTRTLIAVQSLQIKVGDPGPGQEGVDVIREISVRTVPTRQTICPAYLVALALDHRIEAERETCLGEQQALHRVADIYTVLATIDMPTEAFERLTS
jgi:hypothetical protein